MIYAERYHDISCGHRVVGHEGKCQHLHGHNYRIHFRIEAVGGLDPIGRVLDFGVIKARLCQWLEDYWDHKFLVWEHDQALKVLGDIPVLQKSFVYVPFNPTAENMALHLLNWVAPLALGGTGAQLVSVRIEETRKCSVVAELKGE